LKKLYQQAEAELERELSRAIGRGNSPLTINQHKAILTQLRQGQMAIAARLGTALGQASVETQREAARALSGDIRKIEKHGGRDVTVPIDEASKFAGVVDKKRTSLMKLSKQSMATWGASTVKKMEEQLALSLVQNETGHQAIDRLTAMTDAEWWRAERVVRTELAWAYNATQLDAVHSMKSDFPDMQMRWVELVDDWTLTKMDDRVGNDSVALHGQVATKGMFFFPKNPPLPVGDWFNGKSWAHPPNRPNDRAVLQPWRPHWGGYAWEYVGGQKRMLTTKPR